MVKAVSVFPKVPKPKLEISEITGPEFVEIMEQYGIKPSELGISRSYKNKLKKGERKPSRQLIAKLMERIGNEKMLVDRPGFEPGTSRMPTERSTRLSYRPTYHRRDSV